ncbi:reticulocalbin-2-like [Actinia tenebrosa]|uniref:Reticulocalbin-3 n=1 Tax=Actinia tenebrosa TaxID=6105 RepID=A0A6P8HML1_ACTTE|nr:reticulocalbin-2-like [Actinia tenebrosa]
MYSFKCLFVVFALSIINTKAARSQASEDEETHEGFEQKILLGEAETKEYYKLSEKEKAQRLRILVEKMDKDMNGTIDEEELLSWIERNHVAYIIRRSREFFEDTDENNDGFVMFDEYERIHYQNDRAPKNYKNTTLYRHEKRRFRFADQDNSGSLTLKEFIYFLHPDEGKHMLECIVEETIDNIDRDNDGLISVKDYIGEGILDMNGEQFVEAVKAFKELDKNGDGVLNKEEVTKWIRPDRKSTAAKEAKHMLEHGDKNKDAQLSYEEVVSMGQMLETSKATQYGQVLHHIKPEKQEL